MIIEGRRLSSKYRACAVFVSVLAVSRWSWCSAARAQSRAVAVTVDDLPYAVADSARAVSPSDGAVAEEINRKLLSALRHHHVPTGRQETRVFPISHESYRRYETEAR
jgi:hypothetical protein